ncbi:hypothetical protein Bca52824_082934 [Brassica carinata]|uniref:Uncharacterized protein n=1 Tax=Brassica carinata TaxID=52824 RepID=A0A8X7PL93_BRACI|nr:hypothetical protein Bca52824_082934 [Brassica carinata]
MTCASSMVRSLKKCASQSEEGAYQTEHKWGGVAAAAAKLNLFLLVYIFVSWSHFMTKDVVSRVAEEARLIFKLIQFQEAWNPAEAGMLIALELLLIDEKAQSEVFLVEVIDSISVSKESMSHLKAVYFIRPTSENIQKLRYQLANPRFGEHHLFFSNLLKDTQIHILADSDEHEAVQQVQEFYADFVAGDPYHLTLNMASNHLYMLPAVVDPSGLQRYSDRVVDGIAAVFLALKRRPVIRYQRTSDTAKRIAHETAKLMYQHESGLFDFRRLPHGLISGHISRWQKSNQNIQTVEEMARFVDNYPEYKKMQGNVSKHATLVTEMSKLVEARRLMLVSQTEQDLACNGGQGAAYEQTGVEKRTGDLFGNRDLMNIARNMARGLKGVEMDSIIRWRL